MKTYKRMALFVLLAFFGLCRASVAETTSTGSNFTAVVTSTSSLYSIHSFYGATIDAVQTVTMEITNRDSLNIFITETNYNSATRTTLIKKPIETKNATAVINKASESLSYTNIFTTGLVSDTSVGFSPTCVTGTYTDTQELSRLKNNEFDCTCCIVKVSSSELALKDTSGTMTPEIHATAAEEISVSSILKSDNVTVWNMTANESSSTYFGSKLFFGNNSFTAIESSYEDLFNDATIISAQGSNAMIMTAPISSTAELRRPGKLTTESISTSDYLASNLELTPNETISTRNETSNQRIFDGNTTVSITGVTSRDVYSLENMISTIWVVTKCTAAQTSSETEPSTSILHEYTTKTSRSFGRLFTSNINVKVLSDAIISEVSSDQLRSIILFTSIIEKTEIPQDISKAVITVLGTLTTNEIDTSIVNGIIITKSITLSNVGISTNEAFHKHSSIAESFGMFSEELAHGFVSTSPIQEVSDTIGLYKNSVVVSAEKLSTSQNPTRSLEESLVKIQCNCIEKRITELTDIDVRCGGGGGGGGGTGRGAGGSGGSDGGGDAGGSDGSHTHSGIVFSYVENGADVSGVTSVSEAPGGTTEQTKINSMEGSIEDYLQWANDTSDVLTVLNRGQEVVADVNAIEIQSPLPYGVHIDIKNWYNGLLDMDKNGSYSYDELFERIMRRPNDSNKDSVITMMDKISTVMLMRLQDLHLSKLDEIIIAVNAFAATLNDTARTSTISTGNAVEAYQVLAKFFIQLASDITSEVPMSNLTKAVQSLMHLTDALLITISPENLPSSYFALVSDSTRSARQFVEYMNLVNKDMVYILTENAKVTPEERTNVFKLQAKVARMKFKKKQSLANKHIATLLAAAEQILAQLLDHVCIGCNQTFMMKALSTTVMRTDVTSLMHRSHNFVDLELSGVNINEESKSEVLLSTTVFHTNPFIMGTTTKSSSLTSKIVRLKFNSASGKNTKIHTATISLPVYNGISGTIHPKFTTGDASKCFYHTIMYRDTDDQICVNTAALNSGHVVDYEVYMRFGRYPTHLKYDISSTLSQKNAWTTCVTPDFSVGTVYICLRPSLSSKTNAPAHNMLSSDPSSLLNPLLSPYNLTVVTASCQVWNDQGKAWNNDGKCKMEWKATRHKLKCKCKNIEGEITLGNSLYVPPNTISFSDVFLRFSPLHQAPVLGLVSAIIILYILLIIWSRYEDKKDIVKWGVTAMADNYVDDTYYYLVTLHTGMRFGAGTNSTVRFAVYGLEDETGVRKLSDGIRKGFKTGSVMHFVMATNHPLGDLYLVNVWLESGTDGSLEPWYLNKMNIEDLQTHQRYVFLCDSWIGTINKPEAVLPVCGKENVMAFKQLFYHNIFETLAENHIIISIFYRPINSNYTRVQRVTTLFVFSIVTMLSNTVYFSPADEFIDAEQFKLGPLIITYQTVYVSIVTSFISSVVLFVLMFVFRKSKPKYDRYDMNDSSLNYAIPGVKDSFPLLLVESRKLEKILIAKNVASNDDTILPSWCLTVAWIASFLISAVALFFILLYSVQWGKQKTEMWITECFLSFGETTLIFDQIKIPIIAAVFAMICTPQTFRSVLDRSTILQNYKQVHTNDETNTRQPAKKIGRNVKKRALREYKLRQQTLKIIRDFIVICILIGIVSIISIGNRDERTFQLQENIKSQLSSNGIDFNQITTMEEYDKWINEVVFPVLFPELDPYGDLLHWRLRQYTSDFSNFRIGPPRMRQLRVGRRSRDYPMLGVTWYYPSYDSANEVKTDSCQKWTSIPCDLEEETYSFSNDAWKYSVVTDVLGTSSTGLYNVYSGDGYIAEYDVNRVMTGKILSELTTNRWIDRNTRAVFLEFTLYSPNVNVFTYATFVAEFPETGGIITMHDLRPLRVYQHHGRNGFLMLVSEISFLVIEIFFCVRFLYQLYKHRKAYFESVSRNADLVILLLSIAATVVYFVRFFIATETMKLFHAQPKSFLSIQRLVSVDFIFTLLLTVLQFSLLLRLVGALKFSKNIQKLYIVLNGCFRNLRWFSLLFIYLLIAYSILGSSLFGRYIHGYSNVVDSAKSLFLALFSQVARVDPIEVQVYFFFFMLTQFYLMLSMFMSILGDSIDNANKIVRQAVSLDVLAVFTDWIQGFLKTKLSANKEKKTNKNRPSALWKDIADCCHEELKNIQHQTMNVKKSEPV